MELFGYVLTFEDAIDFSGPGKGEAMSAERSDPTYGRAIRNTAAGTGKANPQGLHFMKHV